MLIAVTLAIGLSAAAVEVPKLLKSKSYRELIFFSIFLLTSLALVILETFGIKLPSPSDIIESVVKHIVKANFGYQQD